MANWFILTDGSTDKSANADPTPTNTEPTVVQGTTTTSGVARTNGAEVVRLMFGGTDADNEDCAYQVIGWHTVIGPNGTAYVPELLAAGVATLGGDQYAATDMGGGDEYLADTITDTLDRLGTHVYSPADDTRAVIDIPLRGAMWVQVDFDKDAGSTEAATIDVWAMFASSGACGIGGNTVDVEVEAGDISINDFDSWSTLDEGSGAVSVGATSTAILAANADRKYACIVNISDEWVYLGLGEAAVADQGIPLAPNGMGKYEITPDNRFVGAVNGICASGSKTVTKVEA